MGAVMGVWEHHGVGEHSLLIALLYRFVAVGSKAPPAPVYMNLVYGARCASLYGSFSAPF